MRQIIAALLLLLFLAGCGSDPQDPGSQPEAPEPELVQMLAITSAGGEVSPEAYFVDDPEQMKAYVKQFEDRDLVIRALQRAVKDAADRDGRLAVATVALECDVPPGVHVTEGAEGPEVHPKKVADPKKECFAPITSVALVEIP